MRSLLFFVFALLLYSCTTENLQAEKEELLRINQEQRTAHMTNDASLLVASMADSLITVDGGNIYRSSRQQVEDRFTNYFSTVKYFKWDDMEAPEIHVSPDATMATVSVRKEVIARNNSGFQDTTIFAWTSAYQKLSGHWKMYSITSTDNQ